MSGFDRLNPVIQHHIVGELGWPGLRPLQEQAIAPVLAGSDALLLAPTAGGKTEAAIFPLLTRMHDESWTGTSLLYVTPLKALLNNLHPRLQAYARWVGRSARLRHGDTTAGQRARMLWERPDILLTTPESLEAMLISTKVTPEQAFGDVRAIVIDEIHAFAGDDRGWHLLALIDRVAALSGVSIQRIGLSATVGNPDELLGWLRGPLAASGDGQGVVVAPPAAGPSQPEVQLDHVGSIANAAKLIKALHARKKRLVFCESRRRVEQLGTALKALEVDTFLSHSSLSADERRIAESAFANARDCVIVSTSTLELGIDVGDLDRVLQLGGPSSVASMLQRMGRTGRRPQTTPNMLLLGVEDNDFLAAAGVAQLWSEGFVEPIVPPIAPAHVVAQQMLGLALQEGQVSEAELVERVAFAPVEGANSIRDRLEQEGFLDRDGDLLFVGPEADRRYGQVYFRDLVAVFSAPPQFVIRQGRHDIGQVDPLMLTRKVEGPRILTLGGRSWQVNHIDWKRRVAYVEPSERTGSVSWASEGRPVSFALADAMRRVLLGAEPAGVRLTRRAIAEMEFLRGEYAHRVHDAATLVAQGERGPVWWTWAGARANAVLHAAIGVVAPEIIGDRGFDNLSLKLTGETTPGALAAAIRSARTRFGDDLADVTPQVTDDAVRGLKFAEMLPLETARRTLAQRNADHTGAAWVASRPIG